MEQQWCPECEDGTVGPWVDCVGNIVWMCDQVNEVWRAPEDVGVWPSYDGSGSRAEWVTLAGNVIDARSLRRKTAEELDVQGSNGPASPALEQDRMRGAVGYALRALAYRVDRLGEHVDPLRVDWLIGEHRLDEALDDLVSQVEAQGISLDAESLRQLKAVQQALGLTSSDTQ